LGKELQVEWKGKESKSISFLSSGKKKGKCGAPLCTRHGKKNREESASYSLSITESVRKTAPLQTYERRGGKKRDTIRRIFDLGLGKKAGTPSPLPEGDTALVFRIGETEELS